MTATVKFASSKWVDDPVHGILTRLSEVDILKLVPDDLTPDQISQIMPVIREISILSGLAAGILRGK